MALKRVLNPKPLFDEEAVLEAFASVGIKPKQAKTHATKIWRLFLQQGVTSYDGVPELPKAAREILEKEFTVSTSKVLSRTDASDGSTTKLLVELQDGQRIESVIMRYGDVVLETYPEEEKRKLVADDEGKVSFRSNKRATLCVSSQVGCAMGCTFCATGTMGLLSNLSSGEILEQLIHANKVEKIRNIVFMGMGEPLDNYDAVLSAIKGMVDTSRFSLSPHRISVSTVGVIPRIHALQRDAPDVGLALSLHAPTQSLRTQIVPTAKAWPIDRIMAATDAFIANQNAKIKSHNRRKHVLVEYVMIADVNDTVEVAHQLGELLKGRDVLLNLIPYNPTAVPHDYKAPSTEAKATFVDIVRNQYGVHTLLRQTLGQDVSSACGQLVIDSQKASSCGSGGGHEHDEKKRRIGTPDLEDLVCVGKGVEKPVPGTRRRREKSVEAVEEKVGEKGVVGSVTDGRAAVVGYALAGLAVLVVARIGWKLIRSRAR
ncbi:sorting nexin [Rhizophlyctis rosea]|nr:sorting nexin [Rhizophlyctis rosea]